MHSSLLFETVVFSLNVVTIRDETKRSKFIQICSTALFLVHYVTAYVF
jgi:hypothetical protein